MRCTRSRISLLPCEVALSKRSFTARRDRISVPPHMAAWVWMWDGGREGEEVTHYQPYSEKDSQLLEENFEASGFKATTALSLNGRKYIIRKTRKGWVQEVDGQPQFWRAVKRVQRHSAPPSSPSPNSIAPPAAASPNFELSQLRLEREARQRTAASSTTTSPAVASSPAASPSPSAISDSVQCAVARSLLTLELSAQQNAQSLSWTGVARL